jgi:hypothetical protein
VHPLPPGHAAAMVFTLLAKGHALWPSRVEARRFEWAAWKTLCDHLHASPEYLVGVCVCCGRVRTLESTWRVPPSLLQRYLRQVQRLSHTYCPDCLRAQGID